MRKIVPPPRAAASGMVRGTPGVTRMTPVLTRRITPNIKASSASMDMWCVTNPDTMDGIPLSTRAGRGTAGDLRSKYCSHRVAVSALPSTVLAWAGTALTTKRHAASACVRLANGAHWRPRMSSGVMSAAGTAGVKAGPAPAAARWTAGAESSSWRRSSPAEPSHGRPLAQEVQQSRWTAILVGGAGATRGLKDLAGLLAVPFSNEVVAALPTIRWRANTVLGFRTSGASRAPQNLVSTLSGSEAAGSGRSRRTGRRTPSAISVRVPSEYVSIGRGAPHCRCRLALGLSRRQPESDAQPTPQHPL